MGEPDRKISDDYVDADSVVKRCEKPYQMEDLLDSILNTFEKIGESLSKHGLYGLAFVSSENDKHIIRVNFEDDDSYPDLIMQRDGLPLTKLYRNAKLIWKDASGHPIKRNEVFANLETWMKKSGNLTLGELYMFPTKQKIHPGTRLTAYGEAKFGLACLKNSSLQEAGLR